MPDNHANAEAARPAITVEIAKDKLSECLKNNPFAEIKEDEFGLYVGKLWNDESIMIRLTDSADECFSALNKLYFPERYSAVYHIQERKLEVLWTCFSISPSIGDIPGRAFDFVYKGIGHKCSFGASSPEVIEIAYNAIWSSNSDAGYRNLPSFTWHARQGKHPDEYADIQIPKLDSPKSFWIENVTWDEAGVLDLIRNLNFHLTYYDAKSPNVLIHAAKGSAAVKVSKTRYTIGKFPSNIRAREIDETFLHFWEAARDEDAAWQFLYCYRLIEYASYAYIDTGVRSNLRRIICMPHALDDVDALMDGIVGAMSKFKLDDFQKIEALVKECVDPENVHREIMNNPEAFDEKIEFDGGFCLQPLISKKPSLDEFKVNGLHGFTKSAREIRNALSHGKEQKSAAIILPTPANFRRLKPWALLMQSVTGELILSLSAR